MVDTNVLVSALLFPSERMDKLLCSISTEHRLVLSSFIIEELQNVTLRRFPDKVEAVEAFLSKLPFELVYTPKRLKLGLFEIRNEKDYPVLYSAVTENVDVFITGDKDFFGLGLERPVIIDPAGFLNKY
jgi:putative PIN family toxin of toxin-antitoxin system